MDDEDGPTLSVDDFVDYCRTQAGLLSGKVETMGAEVDDLLDEIDEELEKVRDRLGNADAVEGTESPPSPDAPDDVPVDVGAIADLESDLEERQMLVEAKQARMHAFQDLAVAYTDLAEELTTVDDGRAAMERVVRFEAEHDAPAYFDERETVYEAAVEDV